MTILARSSRGRASTSRWAAETYRRNPAGQLVRLGGLYHHLTLRGSRNIDVNYAPVEVLRAAGLAPADIDRIVGIRAQRPVTADDIQGLTAQNEGFSVGVGGSRERGAPTSV